MAVGQDDGGEVLPAGITLDEPPVSATLPALDRADSVDPASSMASRAATPAPAPFPADEAMKEHVASEDPAESPASRISLPLEDFFPASLADPLIGLVVAGRYRILTPIGRGGMGVVYKVEHVHLGKLLAMKLLTGELSTNPDIVRRFKREALTVSRLSSPSTVHVFDYGVDAGLTYIVMELVAGRDLAALLAAEGPISFARLGKIVVQVLASLDEAHRLGIVHRDVKPQNVMITRTADGTDVAKVLDFGIAKLREEADVGDVTRRDQLIGTPYFISPEQIRGDAVDSRADIYALGVLMYQALTGHYPYIAKSSASILVKHITDTPLPPSQRAPERGIPPEVDAIVLRTLEKDPARRWESAEALRDAIAEELRELGTSSVEDLLDANALRRLTREAFAETVPAGPGEAIASRDEVAAYERKLRSRRHIAVTLAVLVLVATGAAGLLYMAPGRAARFAGVEVEPNDTASNASPLPLGAKASGLIGKRIDAQHSDRDFYAFEIPADVDGGARLARIAVTGLPNMEMCTLLYRQGFASPFAQYCVGRVGRDLVIGALRLEPGGYYASVLQDLDSRGERRIPFVHENVSDAYTIEVALAQEAEGTEIEPNDEVSAAMPIAPGAVRTGTIGWMNDQDVYCVTDAEGEAIRWRARDVVRDTGAVLEVAMMRGRDVGPPLRVHVAGTGAIGEYDARSPWVSQKIEAEAGIARCLRVRIARDGWAADVARVPAGGLEAYAIEVERVP
jgi:serine/threonine-protein kinase